MNISEELKKIQAQARGTVLDQVIERVCHVMAEQQIRIIELEKRIAPKEKAA